MQRLFGLFVGAVVGTLFVFSGTDDILSSPMTFVLRVLAVVVLAGAAVIWLLGVKVAQSGGTLLATPAAAAGFFGRRYGFVVAAEVVLLVGGLTTLRAWALPEQVNVASLAFVAGVHFVALAPAWHERAPLLPGVVLVMLGVAGFAMATTTPDRVPAVIGVLSGFTILAGSAACAWRTLTSMR